MGGIIGDFKVIARTIFNYRLGYPTRCHDIACQHGGYHDKNTNKQVCAAQFLHNFYGYADSGVKFGLSLGVMP